MRITVDTSGLDGLLDRVRDGLADALEEVTEDALGEAQRVVPIEEATLSRSGFAEVDRQALEGQVAFDTPYAVIQHERADFRHDAGRQSHYLQDPVEQNRARYVDRLQRAVNDGAR